MATPGTSPSPLLDFKQPFDVVLLDATIKAFYGAGSNQEVLTAAHITTPSMHSLQATTPAFAVTGLKISNKHRQDQMRMCLVVAAVCRLMTVISSTPLDPTEPGLVV